MGIMGEYMDCKECEKLIPAFISDSLHIKKSLSFLEHVEKCEECKEELAIQILIAEGMVRLEEGSAFDLQNEIAKKMQAARKTIKIHKFLKSVKIIMELCALLAIGILIAVYLI